MCVAQMLAAGLYSQSRLHRHSLSPAARGWKVNSPAWRGMKVGGRRKGGEGGWKMRRWWGGGNGRRGGCEAQQSVHTNSTVSKSGAAPLPDE